MSVARVLHVTFVAIVIGAIAPASAATKSRSRGQGTGPLVGLGVGALLPEGSFADFNDPSYYVQSRSLYVEKIFGGRAAAYYGDTKGSNGADGGRVYGFDFDALVKFGSPTTFGYAYAGAGYGTLTYTVAGSLPGSTVRHGTYDWCWVGGMGITIKRRFYLEASYVSYQTSPDSIDFIPVVIGFQF